MGLKHAIASALTPSQLRSRVDAAPAEDVSSYVVADGLEDDVTILGADGQPIDAGSFEDDMRIVQQLRADRGL